MREAKKQIILKSDERPSGRSMFMKRWHPETRLCTRTNASASWICFHIGRPRSLLQRDIGIEPPRDPLLRVLYDLTKMMSRSADEMFGRHHDSLLHLWKLARSITDDHRSYDSKVQETLGFGIEKGPQPGEIGVRQVMLVTRT
jgi:hypothetical protein